MTGMDITRRTPRAAEAARGYRMLRYAAFLFAATLLLHGADHMRRGLDAITPQVLWGGVALALAAAMAMAAVIAGHRLAPLMAAVIGFATAPLVGAAHLLPRWSAFSDAFPGSGVDLVSWAAVLGEIAAALLFGAAGAYVLRAGRTSDGMSRGSPDATTQGWRRMKRVIAGTLGALLAGNAMIMLAASWRWYAAVPGVAQTGPYNPHFVSDIAMAYLVAAGGLGWFAWRPAQGWAALVGAAAFLALHSAVHVRDAISSAAGGADLARDFAGVLAPALIAGWIALTAKPDRAGRGC